MSFHSPVWSFQIRIEAGWAITPSMSGVLKKVGAADSDTSGGDLESQGVAQRPDPGLAGRVAALERRVDEGCQRRDSKEVTLLVCDMRECRGEGAPDAIEVDVDRALPLLGAQVGHGCDGLGDAGICHDDIQSSEVGCGGVNRRSDAVEIADIDRPSARDIVAAEVCCLLRGAGRVEIEQGQVRAPVAKLSRQGGAEAAGRASDQDGTAAELKTRHEFFSLCAWIRR